MNELTFDKYLHNNLSKNVAYKIGIIGASRVGKTSLIAALLDETNTYLAQSGISIKPYENEGEINKTKDRIESTISDIESGMNIESMTFEKKLGSTKKPFIFNLEMTINQVNSEYDYNTKLNFAILDYLGEWLSPTKQDQQDWEKCKEWIKDSSVVIAVVDANLVMEADSEDKVETTKKLMQIQGVQQIIEDWANSRKNNQKSGSLLFVPVKCESYFNDNGGRLDESLALYKRITEFYYKDTIKSIKRIMFEPDRDRQSDSESSTYTIEYHPVDTIGSIEIARANWEKTQYGLGLILKSEYLLRYSNQSKPQRKPLGAMGLLVSICQQIVNEKFNNRGIWQKIKDRTTDTNYLLANAITTLAKVKHTSRFKKIYPED